MPRKTAGHPYKFPGSFGDGTNGQLRTEPRGLCSAIGIEAAHHCRYVQVVAQPDESEFSQPILAKRVWSAMEIARRRISSMLLPAIQKSEGSVCFSATGSFVLSGVLTALGTASMARNSSRSFRMFAGIPLLFAAQQAAEGTVWLTMHGDHYLLNRLAVSAFLGIALVVWPTWLPFALRLVERDPTRRRGLGALFWAGGVVAACALVLLFRFQPMAQIAGHSIRYEYAGSGNAPGRVLYLGAYVVPTVVPFFVSTLRLARPLGIVLVLSLVASVIVQRDALTSVWCFFAAILSCLILIAVAREQHANAFARPTPGT